MRGSPFLMPVYGAGVAFWQGCAAVKSGMLHGGVCGVRVRLRGAVAVQRRECVLPLGAGVWWPVHETGRRVLVWGCAVNRCVRCASMVRGSGGVRSRVCGFMHRDEGTEHRKTGERGTAENTPLWNKCPECYTEDRHGAENSCLWKSGKMLENLDFH